MRREIQFATPILKGYNTRRYVCTTEANVKGKGQRKLKSLGFNKHHAIKMYGGNGDMASTILILGNGWN